MYTQLCQKILTSFLLSMASSIVPIVLGTITLNQAEKAALRWQQSPTKHQATINPMNPQDPLFVIYPELELATERKAVMASTIDLDFGHPSQHRVMSDRSTILEKLMLEFLKNPMPHARLWARFIILIATRKDNQLQLDQPMLPQMLCLVSR
jgi:hypothetical protein